MEDLKSKLVLADKKFEEIKERQKDSGWVPEIDGPLEVGILNSVLWEVQPFMFLGEREYPSILIEKAEREIISKKSYDSWFKNDFNPKERIASFKRLLKENKLPCDYDWKQIISIPGERLNWVKFPINHYFGAFQHLNALEENRIDSFARLTFEHLNFLCYLAKGKYDFKNNSGADRYIHFPENLVKEATEITPVMYEEKGAIDRKEHVKKVKEVEEAAIKYMIDKLL